MTSVVSSDFIYEQHPRGSDCYSYRTQFASEDASYALGSIIRIPISSVHNGFLSTDNSWLNVKVEFPSINGTGLSSAGTHVSHIGLNSLWDQINVLGPNGYLQQYQNYQATTAINAVSNLDINNYYPGSITQGYPAPKNSNTEHCSLLNPSITVDTDSSATEQKVTDDNALEASVVVQGLMSGAKSIPIGWLHKDLVLELYVTNDVRNILFTTTGLITAGSTAKVSVNFDCQIDVVTDNAMNEIEGHAGGRRNIVSWSDTQQSTSTFNITKDELITSSQAQKTHVIAGKRPRKLLSIIQAGFRSNIIATANETNTHDPWEFTNPYVCPTAFGDQCQFHWRIGSHNYPPRPMASSAECTQQLIDCYNQSCNSVVHNRYNKNTSKPRIIDGGNQNDINRSGVGLNLCQFDQSADGLDTSRDIIESQGSLLNYILYDNNGVADATQPTVSNGLRVVTLMRYGVLYSVDETGDMSVSY